MEVVNLCTISCSKGEESGTYWKYRKHGIVRSEAEGKSQKMLKTHYHVMVVYHLLCSDDLSSWILASCQLHRVTRMLNKRKPEKMTDIRKCSRMNCRSGGGNRKCEDAEVHHYLIPKRGKQKVWRCRGTSLLDPKEGETRCEDAVVHHYLLRRKRMQKVWRCSAASLLAPKEKETVILMWLLWRKRELEWK